MSLALEIVGLRKSFAQPDGTSLSVVDIERFALEAGAQVGLHAPSGSGKTTFLNLIAGILSPDAGHVIIDGAEITCPNERDRDRIRARKIGYVFQSFNLLQGYTAVENVCLGMRFGAGVEESVARSLLARVGLADRLDHFPRQLSAGQQQRVALARALAGHPTLVLADEPTGNLDRQRAADAGRLLRELCRDSGASLVLATHDAQMLAAFDHVVRLDELQSPGQHGVEAR
jgi:ABC-type lipoprotein export system ATPase subunit